MNIFEDKAFSFAAILWFIALVVIIAIWRFAKARDFETRRLYFAAGILTGLGLLFALSMGMYYWEDTTSTTPNGSSAGKEIFEACLNVLPPIVTLVIGYYFGATKSNRDNTRELDKPDAKSNQTKEE